MMGITHVETVKKEILVNTHDTLLTRRSFLNRTGVGLGAAALPFALPSASLLASQHEGEKSLGIALVGLGTYATTMLMPGFKHTKHCHLAGLVTGTPEKKIRYGREHDIPDTHIYNYETFDRIAENPDIDIVYVVLPNSMHAEYTIRAAEAGKHVICEKPMSLNVAEAKAMIAACRKNNVILNIGYRCQYEPYNLALIKVTEKGTYGRPVYIQSEMGFVIGDANQWRFRKDYGGGALMDVGVYCMQAARYVSGKEPIAVSAQEYKTDPSKFAEVDETVTFQMEFPSGTISNSTTSFNLIMRRLYVSYERESAVAEIDPNFTYDKYKGHINGVPMDIAHVNHQGNHMDVIAQSIQSGTPTTTTGEEGLRDMRVIEAIFKSIANGGARTKVV